MGSKFRIVKELAEKTDGIVTTEQIVEAGLSRTVIRTYLDKNLLVRESQGIYSLSDSIADSFALLQKRSKKLIYSYGTALYLNGMSDRTPDTIHVTVPQGYNASRIKRDNPMLELHYINEKLWPLGILQVTSPMGAEVLTYDKERTICDLIRDRKEVDLQVYAQGLKEYFKADSNIRKLINYGKVFGIEEKVRIYIEVLT